MAPVAPNGCPIAIAPPLTFTLAGSTFSSVIKRITTAAKASLTSNRSISSMLKPALAKALRAAGAGPVSMMVGSAPTNAVASTLARGFKPCSLTAFSEASNTTAAPSTIPDELPAWWTWLMCCTSGYFCNATASKPICPIMAKLALSLARLSVVVAALINSSLAKMVTPAWSFTATTD